MPLNQNGYVEDSSGNEIEGGQIQLHSCIQHQNLIERTRILLHDIIIRTSFSNYKYYLLNQIKNGVMPLKAD